MIEPAELDFDAGQWISVPFGPKIVRAWSMVSTPARKRTLTLAVDVAPGEAAAVVDRLVHSVDRLVAYVCGGGDTVNAVRDALVKKGMDRKSVKWEKFW